MQQKIRTLHFLPHAANAAKSKCLRRRDLYTNVCHSLAEPGFHILCCCHSFMVPLQLLTQFSFNIFSGKAPNSGCGGSCPTAFRCRIFSAKAPNSGCGGSCPTAFTWCSSSAHVQTDVRWSLAIPQNKIFS